ncbi:MAG: hypothetical protein EXS13_09330 [Planctomycetes bacterium]|nr:hypothetical protein [Planctomycetota bacterium]
MSSRRLELLPRWLPLRAAAATLVLAWLLGIAGTLFHRHEDHAHSDPDHAEDCSEGPACSGQVRERAETTTLSGECPDGDGCRDPFHHHHSHAPPIGAATHCSVCSSLFERHAIPIAPFTLAIPITVRFVVVTAPSCPASEPSRFALARGPPDLPATQSRCALHVV